MINLFHSFMSKLGRYRRWLPFNITLHKIVRSDDPIFHDHPWPFIAVILKGGYWEHVPMFDDKGRKFAEIAKWHGPGSVIYRKAKDFHWVELDAGKPATTLFFMGQQQREWGFLVEVRQKKTRWIRYDYYLNNWKKYHEKYIVSKKKI